MTARTLAWTGFIAIAAFTMLAASRLTMLESGRERDAQRHLAAAVDNASHTEPFAAWVNNITDAGSHDQNKQLREENERLTTDLARAREDAIQQQNPAGPRSGPAAVSGRHFPRR